MADFIVGAKQGSSALPFLIFVAKGAKGEAGENVTKKKLIKCQ
jgi:hypothetical protein